MVQHEKSTRCTFLLVAAALAALLFVPGIGGQTPDSRLDKIADRFVDQQLRYDPTLSYFTGVPTSDHSRFADLTPQAIEREIAEEREDLREVLLFDAATLPPHARATYATLREQLESDLQMRVRESSGCDRLRQLLYLQLHSWV